MVEVYKRATVATDRFQEECAKSQDYNADLSEKLRETEEKLKEAKDRVQTQQLPNRSQELDHQVHEQLKEAEKTVEDATARATTVEQRVKKLEDLILLAKTEISKWLDAKDEAIQRLKRRLVQQQDETKQHEEKEQEVEEYIRIQEEYRDRIPNS